jgi:ABC-2 type transport system permease protein
MFNGFGEILKYKELLINLTKKELKLKYKNSVIGFLWSFLNPLMMLIIYTFAFKVILKIPIENFCGLLPWIFFQSSIQMSTTSIISASNLIKKVYFPRQIVPLSQTISNFINFLITLFILLIAAVFVFKIKITIAIIVLPIILIMLFLIVFGIGLALSALNVFYRDVSHFVEVFFMLWFYLTPIIYSIDMLPKKYQTLLFFNPITPIILSIREIILNGNLPTLKLIGIALMWSIIFMVIGTKIFSKREHRFAEEV